jgi:hypothetical protein
MSKQHFHLTLLTLFLFFACSCRQEKEDGELKILNYAIDDTPPVKWLMLAYTGRGVPDDSLHNNIQIRISKDGGNT